MTRCLSALSVLLLTSAGSCVQPPAGDFCDVAKPDLYASDEVATFMTQNDPAHVQADLSENEYGKENCPEGWWPLEG